MHSDTILGDPTGGSTVSYNAWQQWAVTWSGATATDCKLYKNGSETSYTVASNRDGTGARIADATTDLTIGNNIDTDRAFDGGIALPRLSSSALTANEIASLYRQERHLFGA